MQASVNETIPNHRRSQSAFESRPPSLAEAFAHWLVALSPEDEKKLKRFVALPAVRKRLPVLSSPYHDKELSRLILELWPEL